VALDTIINQKGERHHLCTLAEAVNRCQVGRSTDHDAMSSRLLLGIRF
jgi:hypothetical protein